MKTVARLIQLGVGDNSRELNSDEGYPPPHPPSALLPPLNSPPLPSPPGLELEYHRWHKSRVESTVSASKS